MGEKLTKKKKTRGDRAVTKISSCQVFAISRCGTEQPGSSFGVILIFPTKIVGVMLIIAGGYPPSPALSDSPGRPVFPHFFPLFSPCTI